ncbi:lysozyme [Serratia phage MQ-4]|nr:lysozyme [Serratia phage MQ-4]
MANKKLIGLVGAACAAILYTVTPKYEGTPQIGYLDPVGIPTACTGHTGPDVVVGKRYTKQECEQMFGEDMFRHASGVLKCTPQLKGRTYQLAAASDFAFNKGIGAYCGSSVAAYFRQGDWKNGCRAINQKPNGQPQWVFATDKHGRKVMLPGLVKRAAEIRKICETDL